jgi:hypothetical protein
MIPIEQNAAVYEVEIPVFVNIEGNYKYWLGSLDNGGHVSGTADHYDYSFTTEVKGDADAA